MAVGEGALYLVVQRAEVLEASKAGVAQADQDGKQHDQEGEQGGRGCQTWGQRDASLREAAREGRPFTLTLLRQGPHVVQELWVSSPSGRK